jgi:predicted metal-dependent hydrolase
MRRTVRDNQGELTYELIRKPVKNINLRADARGVRVSAPVRVPVTAVDEAVIRRLPWLRGAVERARRREENQKGCSLPDDAACLAYFQRIEEELAPRCRHFLTGLPPLRVREMTSRWGVCHLRTGVITLNKRLLLYPREAAEYVVLHELVHLLHPNHQAGFHAEMARLMPDYRQRAALLRQEPAFLPGENGI